MEDFSFLSEITKQHTNMSKATIWNPSDVKAAMWSCSLEEALEDGKRRKRKKKYRSIDDEWQSS